MRQDKATWKSYFNQEPLKIKDQLFKIDDEVLNELNESVDYWHSKTDPSSWLIVGLFLQLRRKYSSSDEKQILELTAHGLNVTVQKIISGIRWHDGYMAFKDGGKPRSTLKGKYT